MKIKKLMRKIEDHYAHHNVSVKLKWVSDAGDIEYFVFRFKIKPGTKIEAIFSCAPDIRAALQIPLFRPFRDGEGIYLAVSEKDVRKNNLYDMLISQAFCNSEDILPIALGYDMMHRMVFNDLVKMPHILYAGTSRSGKSSGLICLLMSLLTKQSVGKVNVIIIDTAAQEMGMFNGIPHLSYPVVEDVPTGIYVIGKLAEEMERRISLGRAELQAQPVIVCVIDEFISFVDAINDKKQKNITVHAISEFLRRGRHAKIHMVIAALDPTKENVKVDISNISSRVAFRSVKHQNSSTILGVSGAEKLTGNGAALYLSRNHSEPIDLQGAYMPESEVKALINCVKSVVHDSDNKFLIPEFEIPTLADGDLDYVSNEFDWQKLAEIIMWTIRKSKVAADRIKESFHIGNRVGDFVDKMHEMGIISGKNAKQPRKVLPQSVEELSTETSHFLEQHGYDTESVKNAFKVREEHA